MPTFRELRVWERSHVVVLELYRLTGELSPDARQTLGDDLRRASAQVAGHIAAASRCLRPADYAASLNRAEAALAQTEYLLLLGLDLGLFQPEITSALLGEIDAIDRSLTAMRVHLMAPATQPYHVGESGVVEREVE
jgi:four helix bundle protein